MSCQKASGITSSCRNVWISNSEQFDCMISQIKNPVFFSIWPLEFPISMALGLHL